MKNEKVKQKYTMKVILLFLVCVFGLYLSPVFGVNAMSENCIDGEYINIDTNEWERIDKNSGKQVKLSEDEVQVIEKCLKNQEEDVLKENKKQTGAFLFLFILIGLEILITIAMFIIGMVLTMRDHREDKTKQNIWLIVHGVSLFFGSMNTLSTTIYLFINGYKKWGWVSIAINVPMMVGIILLFVYIMNLSI